MRPTLLRNVGGRLADASNSAGPWFARPILGRGLAVGDLDRDGRPDLVINALDAPAAILRNVSPGGRAVVLELVGRGARVPVGARVRATVAGLVLVRDLVGGGSYLSASDPRISLGLAGATRIDRLEVTWPSGRSESWTDLPASGTVRLVEGAGEPLSR
jgi:hypothetical protein